MLDDSFHRETRRGTMNGSIMAMGTQTQRGDANEDAPAVLPSEVMLMEHFTAHYNTFVDTVKRNINEPFTTSQLIELHRTYSTVWGRVQKK